MVIFIDTACDRKGVARRSAPVHLLCFDRIVCISPTLVPCPMKHTAGNIFLITAPSGAGKSSMVNALLSQDAALRLSVSCTTRAPREGETEGKDYYFVSEARFLEMQMSHELLESAHVHGNHYGTPRGPMVQAMQDGEDILLEIDWQGAAQIRQLLPNATGVFILPPSIQALEQRLRARGKDSEAVIAARMAAAESEIAHANEFEYVIINQEFTDALQQLSHIIASARLGFARQALTHRDLFKALGLTT